MPINCNHILHAGGISNSNIEYRNKLGNAFNTAHMYKPSNQERLPCKMFLVFIKKDSNQLSLTFTMSNYYYCPLSGCDNAGINFIHNHPPLPPHTPGDLHQKFALNLGLLHPSFCPGRFVGKASEGRAFVHKRFFPFFGISIIITRTGD